MKARFALIVGIAALLTGCYDNSSPKNTIGSVAWALKNNKYKNYFSLLRGEAREQFGSEQAFAALQQQLGKFKKVKMGSIKKISSWGNSEEGGAAFATTVLGDGKPVRQAQVDCKHRGTWEWVEGNCHGNHWNCHGRWEFVIRRACFVTKLR